MYSQKLYIITHVLSCCLKLTQNRIEKVIFLCIFPEVTTNLAITTDSFCLFSKLTDMESYRKHAFVSVFFYSHHVFCNLSMSIGVTVACSFFVAGDIPLCEYSLISWSKSPSIDRLDCFQFLSILNEAAVDILVPAFWWTWALTSLG